MRNDAATTWIAALAFFTSAATVWAQASELPDERAKLSSGTFAVGDEIDAARQLLDRHDKPSSVGGFAFAQGPEDVENVIVILDPDHMYLCVWYSKSKRSIQQMSAVCFPARRHGKIHESWIPIRQVQLHDDGTHSLTFAKPLTVAELDAREKEAAARQPTPQFPPGKIVE